MLYIKKNKLYKMSKRETKEKNKVFVKREEYNKKIMHEFKFPKGYLTPEISSDLKHAKVAFKTMNGIYHNKAIPWDKKMDNMKPQLEEFEKYMNKWIKEVIESYSRDPQEVFNSTRRHYENNDNEEEKQEE